MSKINEVSELTIADNIAILRLDSPPVNALSAVLRSGIHLGLTQAINDNTIDAIILICAGRTFIAGADITELGTKASGPSLLTIQNQMEASPKPIIAAMHGTALGGGLEITLSCHYRIAVPSAKCGLPEVKLGLLPGAGGTQRLPRLIGAQKALEFMLSGDHVPADRCLDIGLLDALAEENKLLEDAISFTKNIVQNRLKKNVHSLSSNT